VSVALTPEFIALLKEAVETGEYTSTSEVIRDALREWKLRRSWDKIDAEDLRRLWDEGLASGPASDAEPAFARLRGKYEGQMSKRR
jgi:antitoxin ParD1/3/4